MSPFLADTVRRPQLRARDRLFWVLLAKAWPNWRTALIVAQPDTVVRWHRQWLRAIEPSAQSKDVPAARARPWYSDARRQDGCRKSPLGSPSHPRRTDQARHRGVGTHRVAVPAPTPSSAVTDLVNVLDESRDVASIDGFLHRADAHGSCARRARGAQSPPAPNRPSGDQRTPHSRMDSATGRLRPFRTTPGRGGSSEIAMPSMATSSGAASRALG
jgi:hypothetical protein